MNTVIFNTENAAEKQQVKDLICHLKNCLGSKYAEQTTRWADPRKLLNGKWGYKCCPTQNYKGMTTKEYRKEDYPKPENIENLKLL